MWQDFWQDRKTLDEQYRRVAWLPSPAGWDVEAFEAEGLRLTDALDAEGVAHPLAKARLYAFVMDNAPIAVVPEEFFQDHLRHCNLVQKQRSRWIQRVEQRLAEQARLGKEAGRLGAWSSNYDLGHTVPDWEAILRQGFPGLLARVRQERARHGGTLDAGQAIFYDACEMTLEASMRYTGRLGSACLEAAGREASPSRRQRLTHCGQSLMALTERAPQTLHEALQLAYLYHILQEEVEGERLRSLGGLDRLYNRFYQADIQAGMTGAQCKTLLQYFFQKFHALTGDTFYGEPAYFGGIDREGNSVVCDFTYLIIDAFDELSIANPKFHVRVSEKSPDRLLEKVCDCIRRGNSSFVFINDECTVPMMMKTGASLEEARQYVPVGCYEPVIEGLEVGCTGCGNVNILKAVELALLAGAEHTQGVVIGPRTGSAESLETFTAFQSAVEAHLLHFTDRAMDLICAWEANYGEMNPSPLMSSTMAHCVAQGRDAYDAGAKYNNSSLNAIGLGSAADALAMVRMYVYERKEVSLPALRDILLKDWNGAEPLREAIVRDGEKWGNDCEGVDDIACHLSDVFARRVNSRANARGGRFKASLISIDKNLDYGTRTMATPDGRRRGEPVSRNLGAATAMDRGGITPLIRSITKLDIQQFPNGSVLDAMLHPSAVHGEEGLRAFVGLIRSYCAMGGFAIHLNVFDADALLEAQAHPEKYANLQVRVCGWNVYFVNLSREEQDIFIRQAQHVGA